ncbi:MAG TPA: MBL fold metallo-hydrolase, partial [Polyangiaceae bacterium]|nr:MBL fold metallo-hydrolase [Polyangiaceae bacterium]
RLLPRFYPLPEHRPREARAPRGASLRIRWLGTAGHVVSTDTTTVLLDPFVTRPTVRGLVRPLVPDEAAIERWIPKKVDAVLLGHSHYDHLLDAPRIAILRGAKIVGSRSTAAFARASGVPARDIETIPAAGGALTIGDLEITFVPSRHGRIAFGEVPFDGEVTEPPTLPVPAWRYRMGGAFGIHLRARGRTVYHNGSADLVDAELAGKRADVVLVGLAGRQATRDYLERLVALLDPSVLVPTHHDAFFGALELGERVLPGVDLQGFYREARMLKAGARIVTPLYRDELFVPLDGEPRDVIIA